MSEYLRMIQVFPRWVNGEGWRVSLELGPAQFLLQPAEAHDLSRKLFALAVEVSESSEPVARLQTDEAQALQKELEKEREKRQELARQLLSRQRAAPKMKLEAAKDAVRFALDKLPGWQKEDLAAALAWLEEFKA